MITNRFAVSARSKKNGSTAFNEELLVDKDTGEMLVKTPLGDIISYNYFSRLRNSLNAATNVANTLDIIGKIYSVNLNEYILPCKIDFDINIINEPHIVTGSSTDTFTKFAILLDLDSVMPINGSFVLESELDPTIHLEVKITSLDGTVHDVVIEKPLKEMNNSVHSAIYSDMKATQLSITNITIINNSVIDTSSIRNILSNIILIIDK